MTDDVTFRKIENKEIDSLKDFTYLAIFVPEGKEKPDKRIVELPELRLYYEDFGAKEGDICIVASARGRLVGAVWTRIIDDYGHIDDNTPSLAIAVVENYRGRGLGTRLMECIFVELKEQGFSSVSLSVQNDNFAYNLYKKLGFEVVKNNDSESVMLKRLNA